MSSTGLFWVAGGAAVLYVLNKKSQVKANDACGPAGGGGGYQPPPQGGPRRGRNPAPQAVTSLPLWHDAGEDNLSWMNWK